MNEKADVPNLPALKAGIKPQAIVPESIEEIWRFAAMVVRSGMAPMGMDNVESVAIAMLKGMSLGIQALDAVWSIAIINKRPTIPGDLALAVARSSGLMEEFEEWIDGEGDQMTAHCKVKRRGESKAQTSTFSVADAKRAGLWDERTTIRRKNRSTGEFFEGQNDSPWRRYWPRMLQMRARGFRLRDSFGDVLGGMHISEEFEGVTIDGALAGPQPLPATPMPQPPMPPEPPESEPPMPPEPPGEEIDNATLIDDVAEKFALAAGLAHTEDSLDQAWELYCRPLVEALGGVVAETVFSRLSEIEDAARARIQIEMAAVGFGPNNQDSMEDGANG